MSKMHTRGWLPAVVMLGWLLQAGFAPAQSTWFVTTNGAGAGSSWTDATNSIQGAIDAAGAGDTVLVSNGIYFVANQIAIAKAIFVRGMNPPEGVTLTRDPAFDTRIVYVNAAGAVFDGFTVTNGYAPGVTGGYNGGGIYLNAGLATNCNIYYNKATHRGGGLYLSSTSSIADNCRIVSNEVTGATIGGGGVFFAGAAALLNSIVADNTSAGPGGGVQVRSSTVAAAAIMSNCVISGNGHVGALKRGAGITIVGVVGQQVDLYDCVISNNSGQANVGGISVEGGAVVYMSKTAVTHNKGSLCGGLTTFAGGNVFVSNCVFAFNEAGTYGGGILHGYNSGDVGAITVTHSRIVGNLATNNEGGGIFFRTNGVMEYCEVVSNSAMRSGGGAYIAPQSQVLIRNCLFMGNATTSATTPYQGGGIYIGADGTNTVESCTIAGNQTVGAGGGLALAAAGSNLVFNCIVYSNSAGIGDNDLYLPGNDSTNAFHFSCSPVLIHGAQGNITNAPVFVDPGAGYGLSLAGGDYRLEHSSPCVGAGTNMLWMADAPDLDGRPRMDRFMRQVDMGCYECVLRGALFNLR